MVLVSDLRSEWRQVAAHLCPTAYPRHPAYVQMSQARRRPSPTGPKGANGMRYTAWIIPHIADPHTLLDRTELTPSIPRNVYPPCGSTFRGRSPHTNHAYALSVLVTSMPSRVMTDPKFRNGQTPTVELRSTCKCRGIRRSDTSRDVRTSHVRRRRGGAVKLQLILHYASRSGPLQCVLAPVAMGRRAGYAGIFCQ